MNRDESDTPHAATASSRGPLLPLRLAMEHAPTAIAYFDRDGRCQYLNRSCATLLGVDSDVIVGTRVEELCDKAGFERIRLSLEQALRGEPAAYAGQMPLGSDRTPTIDARFLPDHDRDGAIIGCVMIFTETSAAEQAKEDLETIFRMSADLICTADLNTATFLRINPAFTRVLGHSPGELLGRPFIDFVHPDDRQYTIDVIRNKLLRGDAVISFENRYRCRDGSYRWLDWNSHPIPERGMTYAIAHDVTARKAVEEQVRAERDRAQSYLDIAGVIIVALDQQARIALINREGAALLGRPPQELIGRPWIEEFIPEDRREAVRAVFGRMMAGDEASTTSVEDRILTAGGDERLISWNNTCFRDEAGEIAGTLSSGTDITERRRVERERAELEQELRHTQKMKAVGTLAGGIAHDFNNLLQIIVGYADVLREHLPENDEASDALAAIKGATERANALVRQLLAFGRRQVVEMREVDVMAVVTEMLDLLARLIGEDIELSLESDEAAHWVRADARQLELVLMNLAVNSRDAMPGGGTLKVAVTGRRLTREGRGTQVDQLPPGDYVVLSVTDTGTGMDPETLDRACEPFFSTKEIGSGAGLGLATVYGIVSQHQGRVVIESRLEYGTRVEVWLPATVGDEVPSAPESSESVPERGDGETILLAEDDDALRRLMVRILEGAGYRVFSARNGREAVELCHKHADAIDLFICDAVMPQLGGLDAWREIHAFKPQIRALCITGYPLKDLREFEAESERLRLLNKPLTSADLLTAIRQAMGQPSPP